MQTQGQCRNVQELLQTLHDPVVFLALKKNERNRK